MKFQNPFLQRKTRRFLVTTWFEINQGVVCSTKLCNCCCSHHQQTAWKKWCAGVWEKELCGFQFQLCLWITLQSWASGLTSQGLDLFSSAVGWTVFSETHLRGCLEYPWELRRCRVPEERWHVSVIIQYYHACWSIMALYFQKSRCLTWKGCYCYVRMDFSSLKANKATSSRQGPRSWHPHQADSHPSQVQFCLS